MYITLAMHKIDPGNNLLVEEAKSIAAKCIRQVDYMENSTMWNYDRMVPDENPAKDTMINMSVDGVTDRLPAEIYVVTTDESIITKQTSMTEPFEMAANVVFTLVADFTNIDYANPDNKQFFIDLLQRCRILQFEDPQELLSPRVRLRH